MASDRFVSGRTPGSEGGGPLGSMYTDLFFKIIGLVFVGVPSLWMFASSSPLPRPLPLFHTISACLFCSNNVSICCYCCPVASIISVVSSDLSVSLAVCGSRLAASSSFILLSAPLPISVSACFCGSLYRALCLYRPPMCLWRLSPSLSLIFILLRVGLCLYLSPFLSPLCYVRVSGTSSPWQFSNQNKKQQLAEGGPLTPQEGAAGPPYNRINSEQPHKVPMEQPARDRLLVIASHGYHG